MSSWNFAYFRNYLHKICKEQSIYFSKLGKIVKKLFKMVVNVEILLQMVENGDF